MKNENGMGYIEVPRYVAEMFGIKISEKSHSIEEIQKMREVVHRLIAGALEGLPNVDWEILGTAYKSPYVVEPIGLENDGVMNYIYGEERGNKMPLAIFKNSHLAADYFVWLVSNGQRKINWKLFPILSK